MMTVNDNLKKRLSIAIVTPAHNEESTIAKCIDSVKNLIVPANVELEHVVVADRCTDSTVEISRKRGATVYVKAFHDPAVWPITEAVDYGIKKTLSDIIGKVDADIVLEADWLVQLLPHLKKGVVSVSSYVKTRTGKKWLDFFLWLRDLNYMFAPFGREPRGAARLIDRELLEKIGGLDHSKPTFDTALDLRIRRAGYKSKHVYNSKVTEIRRLTPIMIFKHQLSSGMARKKLGISFNRTLAHSIFRLRPFVLLGYLKESLN